MTMNVLHICGDYPFTPIYHELLSHAANYDVNSLMYVPLEINRNFTRKYDIVAPNVNIMYSNDFSKFDRLAYYTKRNKILRSINSAVDVEKMHCIHAHYLFAAGGVACQIRRQHGIEYVVAVRNSDVNAFFPYMLHLRRLGVTILREAAAVVFLSPAYRDKVVQKYVPSAQRSEIAAKSLVVPNGVSDYWLDHRRARAQPPGSPLKLLYVGELTKNKNVKTSIQVTQALRDRGRAAELLIVGAGAHGNSIRRMARTCSEYVSMHDWTNSKSDLLRHYRAADVFIMPSIHETFGLVFIEALSQGLPLIYTRGQGIDGYFPQGTVGYACDPMDVGQIAGNIEKICVDYRAMSQRCTESAARFSWQRISGEYETIYRRLAAGRDSSRQPSPAALSSRGRRR